MDSIAATLQRIEQKLDTLIASLADGEEDQDGATLDGAPAGRERDQTQSLG